RDGHTVSLEAQRSLSATGLAGDETSRTVNGHGTSMHRDSSTAGVRWARSTTSVDAVVFPAPFARDSWPRSGMLTTSVESDAGVSHVSVITFNGTQFVPMVVDGQTVTIDLARARPGGPG